MQNGPQLRIITSEDSRDEMLIINGSQDDLLVAKKAVQKALPDVEVEESQKSWIVTDFPSDLPGRKVEEESKAIHNLEERIKELRCVYDLSRIVEKEGQSIERVFQAAVQLIPPAWQYPNITCARIIYDEQSFTTAEFVASKWKMNAEIKTYGQVVGNLEVYYRTKPPNTGDDLFLEEEYSLLRVISERLGRIAERIEAEKQSRLASSIVANIQVGLHIYHLEDIDDDSSLRMINVNTAAAAITGITKEKLIGKTLDESFPGLRDMGFPQKYTEVVRSGKPMDFGEFEYSDDNIQFASFSVNAFPLPGNCVGVAFENVTQRKRAEEALQNEKDFSDGLIDTAQVIILVLDTEGRIVRFNRYMEQLSGHSLAEVQGKDWFSTFLPARDSTKIRTLFQNAVNDVQTGGSINPIVTKDGHERQIEWYDKTIKDTNGNPTGLLAVGMDVTYRLAMEDRIRQSEKMEAIGHLAGGIAHDFNNILGGIVGYSEMALEIAPEGSRIENDIEQILKASERATDLVRQILLFSRQSNKTKTPLYLSPIMWEAVQLLRASLPSTIDIKCEFEKETMPILADAVKIHEIVINLCTNASDAMEDEGILEINYSEKQNTSDIDGLIAIIEPGFYSVITITDNGQGMSKEILSHIFDPFYTTKEVGKGTGMGLAVVFGVVKDHGGNIVVNSKPNMGTTFQIYLPKTDICLPSDHDVGVIIQGGTERILFVDDEEALSVMVTDMLGNLGYKVSAFTDSMKALRTFEEAADSFDLVITDQTMPGLSGLELSKKLFQIRKDIPIILCTGFSKTIEEENVLDTGIKGFFMKPFHRKDLAYKIRYILDEKGI